MFLSHSLVCCMPKLIEIMFFKIINLEADDSNVTTKIDIIPRTLHFFKLFKLIFV